MFVEFKFTVLDFDNRKSTLMIKYEAVDADLLLDSVTSKLVVNRSTLKDFMSNAINIDEIKAIYREGIIMQSAVAQHLWNNELKFREVAVPSSLTDELTSQTWASVDTIEFEALGGKVL